MQKTFFRYIAFLLVIEVIFHIACFKNISLSGLLFTFFVTIIFSGLFTILSSLTKKEKINTNIMRVIFILTVIIYSAELVYFSIYESFFSFNGIQFAGALKDGYDKVLLTIFQNIIYILLMLVPTIIIIVKMPKVNRISKLEASVITTVMILCFGYSMVSVNFVNKDGQNSLYNLVYKKNLPIMNVKKMGLLASASLSLERKLFGFNPKLSFEEDILTNNLTALSNQKASNYNIDQDIDFDSLIKNESNESIKYLHNYFSNQQPTEQNEYTGIFKGKNVIFIMAESLDEIAINKDVTPTLYKLKNEGIVFNNYFSPKYPASTADGQYMLEWATLPIIGENYSLIDMVYNTNPYLLPKQLKQQGYKTYVYHDYTGYYNRRSSYFETLNFDGHRYCGDGFDMRCEYFHGSDMEMMDQSIGDFINQDKFYAYYITLSGHGSYDSSNFISTKHLDKVNNLAYSSSIKYYLAANIDFDLAMNKLVTSLEEANKLDDTLIIISSDHTPYYISDSEMSSLSSVDRNNKFDRNRGSLIIYNSTLKEHKQINKYAMNIDVLPTVLNMLDIKYDSRLLIGKDIMAENSEGIAILPDRSWVTEMGSYNTENGTFNNYTNKIDEKYITKITNDVNERYDISVSMQYNDYYKYIFK